MRDGPQGVADAGAHYAVNALSRPANGSIIRFKGAELGWRRPIGPAPPMASFRDVPSGYPFFQVIEALKASGITAECTPSTFCPDATVTRAQMAAFLARALGLYWPY